ncbi:dienelactone hydrolase family protein [Bacillus subtilis subsp. subtilis]|nr:dienelactone hydrolase family protein [Bacillus subtilis subsp. subtilis]
MHIPWVLLFLSTALTGCAHAPGPERVAGIPALATDAVAAVDVGQFEVGRFIAADGTVVPYRLLRPASVRQGQRYPLVLQLHGSGGIGTDNASQLDRLARSWAMPATRERYPAYVLVPQFATRSANYGPASPTQAAQAAPVLGAALELANAFATSHPVDRSRIYAVGFSMGGSAAWLSPTLDPGMFAAIVPISGIAPADSAAARFKELPVLVMHGDADEENPITADQRFFRAVQASGGTQMRFRHYQGLAHQPAADLLPGLWWRDWLFQQRRATQR